MRIGLDVGDRMFGVHHTVACCGGSLGQALVPVHATGFLEIECDRLEDLVCSIHLRPKVPP